jgi:DNA polymerase-3 subunit alpha
MGINILKPDINLSDYKYKKESLGIRFSLATMANVGGVTCREIVSERSKGLFTDFFDFVSRTYGKAVNRKTIESLIDADSFSEFGYNHKTLYENIDSAINYAELTKELDNSLVEKPIMIITDEFNKEVLSAKEKEVFGFYLSNHPIIKYKKEYDNIIDTVNITNCFDEFVNMVLYIDRIKEINTKKNEKMAFISGSDEFGTVDVTIFPNLYNDIRNIKRGDIIYITGRVEKRLSKYQIIVSTLEKL